MVYEMGDKMLRSEYSPDDVKYFHPESNSQFSSPDRLLFGNNFEKDLEIYPFMTANEKEVDHSNDVLNHVPEDLQKGIDILLDLNNKVKKISFMPLNSISTDEAIDQYIWSCIMDNSDGNYSTEMYETKMKSTQQEEKSHMMKSMKESLSYSMINEFKDAMKDAAVQLNSMTLHECIGLVKIGLQENTNILTKKIDYYKINARIHSESHSSCRSNCLKDIHKPVYKNKI